MNKASAKSICDACHFEKSCKLPFLESDFVSSRPVERIHCDLWGQSPVVSNQGFKFYVIFIDHHTRFTWFYPLKQKSYFYSVFISFKQLVENQFQSKILQFQCDGGGEFLSKQFLMLLSQSCIQQRICCPHTPQQNGLDERKHRHLTEIDITMMYHGRVPQHFLVEAFFTAVFLINLLPASPLLEHKSSYRCCLDQLRCIQLYGFWMQVLSFPASLHA